MSAAESLTDPSAPYGVAALGELAGRIGSARVAADAQLEADRGAAEARLWARLQDKGDAIAREELVLLHLPYARSVASVLYRQHVHHETEFREYVQWATLGLIEALDRFDPLRGVRFTTYAYTRILGAIRNGLEHISERQEQISLHRRLLAERVKSVSRARGLADPQQEPGTLFAEMAEIGTALIIGFMLDDTGMIQNDAERLPDGCYEAVAYKQEQRRLHDMIPHLTPREQSVIRLHYLQGMTSEDIATTLRITKGRVSQLHRQALERLRRLLSSPTT